MQKTLIALVRGYQRLVSPLLGHHCRYHPTCSNYAIEAIAQHGSALGTIYALRRLSRCHPWGGEGEDPVPGERRHG